MIVIVSFGPFVGRQQANRENVDVVSDVIVSDHQRVFASVSAYITAPGAWAVRIWYS